MGRGYIGKTALIEPIYPCFSMIEDKTLPPMISACFMRCLHHQ